MSESAPDVPVEPVQKTAPSALMVGGAIVAVLGPLAVVAAVLGGTALSQLTSLRADLAAAREELMLGQERTAKLERQLQQAVESMEQREARTVAQAQDGAAKEAPAARGAFQLTQDETQLVREYIKASPVSPGTTATISVGGELRNAALLPLPSQIAGRAPRLAGGRFTIDRNGAIVISLRKSKRADAVIQPN